MGPIVLIAAALCLGTRTAAADAAVAHDTTPAATISSAAPTSAVVGGAAYTPAATTTSGDPATFTLDPATTNAACEVSDGVVSFEHAGSCVIDADDSAGSTSASQTFTVAPAGTTTDLVVGTTGLTATVAASAPGGGTPTGIVVFSVGGRVLGSSTLAGDIATLAYTVPPNVTEAILASFQGTADYTSSSATVTVNGPDIEPTFVANPTIAAALTSAAPKNAHGWFHTKVRVHFICNSAGSQVLGGCPRSVVLGRSSADLTLSRTIHTISGKVATVTLRGIKIDLTKPRVTIVGAHHHALAHGAKSPVSCAASDRVSGIRFCRVIMTVKRSSTTEAITYTATATSWAGVRRRAVETVHSKL
ncbi:MAG TPA: Ig-like domain-containing protein [Solirubrobacteraceae bacterium]|nr:Ig-like domain-containing protein [Solirubrobacteraceae bacterium]